MAEYDLIERNIIFEKVTELYRYSKGDMHIAYRELLDYILDMPAADVKRMKRGRWFHINNDGFIYCSECNNEAYWDTDYGQQLFDYCPYCGAKMIKDGDTE